MTACPSCGAENRADARFCDSCGAELEPSSAPAREERKIVSVLFCDLVGFTAESEQADPEDVRARLRPYHQLLRERVEAYGGVVEKFIGDAVMAVFGAPVAHEDDAERAVRAGLSILESLEELGASGSALDVRIGVNTGEALVSLDARPEHGEGIVTGDVVNTAARIQTSAPVNGVAVGEGTYRATKRGLRVGGARADRRQGEERACRGSTAAPARRALRERRHQDAHDTVRRSRRREVAARRAPRPRDSRPHGAARHRRRESRGSASRARSPSSSRTWTVAPSSSAGGRDAASRTATESRSGRSARS